MKEEEIENLRFLLSWEKINPVFETQKIDLSHNGLSTIIELPAKMVMLPNIIYLDLSNNNLQFPEVKIFPANFSHHIFL